MRYIGSKTALLPSLEAIICPLAPAGSLLLDVFGGTGAVGRHFKRFFEVHANDILFFSFSLLVANVQLNIPPMFRGLGGLDPLLELNNLNPETFTYTSEPFIFQEFSPGGPARRQYFQEKNALKIDAIRQQIASWKESGAISEAEFLYLCAALIAVVPSVSNIAGTYGAYLKHWDKRAEKPLLLGPVAPVDNGLPNRAYCGEGVEVSKRLSGDVLYLDPPYNARQYLSNYHVLETIALYDAPTLSGKTGVRVDPTKSSAFCKRGQVAKAFTDLLESADFRNIVISYSTEGLLAESELIELVRESPGIGSVTVHRFPYRRYARIRSEVTPSLEELVLVAQR